MYGLRREPRRRTYAGHNIVLTGGLYRTAFDLQDGLAIRDMLTELVGKHGREIVTASDGQEALDRLPEVPRPCLILLDLMMPRTDGWEFLRYKSADPSIVDFPTIVLSGSGPPNWSHAPVDETCRCREIVGSDRSVLLNPIAFAPPLVERVTRLLAE